MNGRASRYKMFAIAALLLSGAAAADERQLDGMAVIGNEELPRALFIVPWKQAELGDGAPAPRSGLINERMGPLDPDVFRRELEHRRALSQAEQ